MAWNALALLMNVLLGMHPEWVHSPPILRFSISATLDPARLAVNAATKPAEPAPITAIS